MKKDIITGKISINSKAVGFVTETGKTARTDDDIMIENSNLGTALHGDTVEVEIAKEKLYGRRTGKVTKVINRKKTRFVGAVEQENNSFWLAPDDKKMYTDIFLPSANEDTLDKKVLVEITDWKNGRPAGKIVEVIGTKGEHDTEMRSIVFEKGFEASFPEGVETEAKRFEKTAFPVAEDEIKKRRDFREILTFTIDPKDAKDFDDALSFRRLNNGNYEIGVHIADVSHYVTPGTELGKEALKRGSSIYLVDRTIPMLPHALSNVICSLNPNEDRLAFGAVFEMNDEGSISKRWFGKTIIHSARRYTYEDAQEILDTKSGDNYEVLNTCNQIAKKLMKANALAGAINFETPEIKFELDENGVPIRVVKKERKDTHKTIEQFMLLANREVAKFIFDKDKSMPGKVQGLVYRIHDEPDPDKIKDLAVLVKALGYNLPVTKEGSVTAKDLNRLFKELEGKPEEGLVKTAAIRSMSKAIYATTNIGHFGLAFEYYTHFTSPIRRYPDLLVHRILETYLQGKKLGNGDVAFFEKAAEASTEREIAASEAERDSIKYKQVEYWSMRVGSELNAIVSGVTEWGMYVEEEETQAEGMIKLKDLPDDSYVLDEKGYSVVGERSGKEYRLGDKIKVKLLRADLDKKTLDFKIMK